MGSEQASSTSGQPARSRLAAVADAAGLSGRAHELRLVVDLIVSASDDSAALILTGAAGVGKTVLLDTARDIAKAADMRVLRGAGVDFEADIGYSGLNQILTPLRDDIARLEAPRRSALEAALGFADGPAATPAVVANEVVSLLRQAAVERPILLIVDDAHWLDRPTASVLGFLARRLAGRRLGLLAAVRSDTPSFFERPGLPQHEVRPLDDAAAASLMRARFPVLSPAVRQRVLAEAQGNPLALLELPPALSERQRSGLQSLPATLPLSRRLQDLFASRVQRLPAETRRMLLLAVLDGTGDLRVLTSGRELSRDDLRPAEETRLVTVDTSSSRLSFRHPLVRSSVADLATPQEHREAHRLLAAARIDDPERRAWHLAGAAVEPDESVAAQLDQAGRRILKRGDATGAVAALIRAADLSPAGADRSRRLAQAAYVGADVTGALRSLPGLLQDANRADPRGASLQAAVATSYLLLNGDGDVDTAHRVLAEGIEAHGEPYDPQDDILVEALHSLMMVCWFGGRPELWEPFNSALDRMTPPIPAALAWGRANYADPVRGAAAIRDDLDQAISKLHAETDPTRIVRIGIAAGYVDRLGGCRSAFERVVRDGLEGGAIASAINAVIMLGIDDFMTGRWADAQSELDQAVHLCSLHGYRLLSWPARYGQALLAGACGDSSTAQALCDEMTGWAAPRRVRAIKHYAEHALTLSALSRGNFEEAYRHASAISPAGNLGSHTAQALWVIMDLVESAVRTGRLAEAAAHVNAIQAADVASLSSRLGLLAGGAAAIATADDRALDIFERTLSVPGVDRWAFDLARVQLAYGECLRRAQAVAESRVHLDAALAVFRRIGADPWATRAAAELRATGQARVTSEDSQGLASLTSQEREIAELAARGLTNKEIGERLFLSHRTVGFHLYRMFPKLGITSRAALRDALSGPAAGPAENELRP